MRNLSQKIISGASNATGVSDAIDTNQIYAASFIGVFSDNAATGTLKVQASNDWDNAGNLQGFVPTNWVDVPSATVSVTAGGSNLIPMPLNISYRWLRISWTRSAGAGTYTVYMNAQGY